MDTGPVTPRAHHVSGGTITGIVLGALTGASLLFMIVWFLLRQRLRRKQEQKKASNNGYDATKEWLKPELPDESKIIYEVSGENGQELPTEITNIAQELQVRDVPQEIDTTGIAGGLEVPVVTQELDVPDVVHELYDDTAMQALHTKVINKLNQMRGDSGDDTSEDCSITLTESSGADVNATNHDRGCRRGYACSCGRGRTWNRPVNKVTARRLGLIEKEMRRNL